MKQLKNLFLAFSLIILLPQLSIDLQAQEASSKNSARQSAKDIIKSNDLDGDGKLSKDEVDPIFRIKRFDKVDNNPKDNLLSQEELTVSYKNAALAKAQRSKKPKSTGLKKVKKSVENFVGGIANEINEVGK
ncbi:MAG: hypothetical protein QNJ31_08515 [Candidatus Caenarcaniphilales bacterium]|nr:hypothetical protein [Candidatus Caenarcaniphilales bacterium]